MQQLGHDDVGVGSPSMILVHGWCCNRSLFGPQVEHFSRERRVVAVDLPGHGASGAGDEYTIEAVAGEVAALGSTLGLEAGIVVGHSLGSMVALAMALPSTGAGRRDRDDRSAAAQPRGVGRSPPS